MHTPVDIWPFPKVGLSPDPGLMLTRASAGELTALLALSYGAPHPPR